jgi:hypothetical protein
LVAALCIPAALAQAQAPPAAHLLPAGTRLDFVADDTVNADAVKAGGRYRVHLAHDLLLDGTAIAAAGTPARLIVTDKEKAADGSAQVFFTLAEFKLRAGELPVTAVDAIVAGVKPGQTIPALTGGSVERTAERVVIHVPVPVELSSDDPHAAYVPPPMKTAGPELPPRRRGASPTPLPTTFNPDQSPAPDASPEATASP